MGVYVWGCEWDRCFLSQGIRGVLTGEEVRNPTTYLEPAM